jgi:hypothetical protein
MNVSSVQLLKELCQSSDRAREPVHPVDQQHVEAVLAGIVESLL